MKTRCCWPPESRPICVRRVLPHLDAAQHLRHDVGIGGARPTEQPHMRIAAHDHDVPHRHGEVPINDLTLRHEGDAMPQGGSTGDRTASRTPAIGTMPRMALRSVLLPPPLGPMMPMTWPRSIRA